MAFHSKTSFRNFQTIICGEIHKIQKGDKVVFRKNSIDLNGKTILISSDPDCVKDLKMLMN